MTPEQKEIVKNTWAQVLPIKDAAADMFYARLFEQYPEVKPYFKSDMKGQGEKLMAMLNQAVMSLDHVEKLIEPLHQAGLAHKGYGVLATDYDKVGECFLWTLSQGLGDGYTDEVAEAWAQTYQTLSSVMIEGANYEAEAA